MTLDKDTFRLGSMTDDQRQAVENMTMFLHNYALKKKFIINGLFLFDSSAVGEWQNHMKMPPEDFVGMTEINVAIRETAVSYGMAGLYSVTSIKSLSPDVYKDTSLVRVSFARGKWW